MKNVFIVLGLALSFTQFAHASTLVDIDFPVAGEVTYADDFLNARSGGRYHYATDIMAAKMTPVLAAVDGVITFAPMSQPAYGYMLTLEGDDGYTYNYVHLNNDTPGTDDGDGGSKHAYAPGIESGRRVERGQQLGWVGDSGNAEAAGAHLHFEIYAGNTPINPYQSLLAAEGQMYVSDFDPEAELARATSISVDKDLDQSNQNTACQSDSLIRTEDSPTVYYCGTDGGRYVFQNESTFFSWYDNFDNVVYISAEDMASIPLAGNVTYRPGSYMIKILSSPKVYAVGQGGSLHWVASSQEAEGLYGPNWATYIRDIPDGFWGSYELED